MSYYYFIFKEKKIEKDEVYSFIKQNGGYLLYEDNNNISTEGVMERNQGTIWITCENNIDQEFRATEIRKIQETFNITPEVLIEIDVGHDDESLPLGREFCYKFMNKYPDTLFMDMHLNFKRYSELGNYF